MRSNVRFLLPVLLVALIAAAPAAAQTSSVERATAAVVAITSYSERIGTGVVIADDRVLTVAHVVDSAQGTPSYVIAADKLLQYEVVAIDRVRDLALIAVDLPADVPAIMWADRTPLGLGEDVIAIGFPIGLTSVTLSKGVVSAPSQEYAGAEFIQTDAAINPGNSGGPLVDARGRLVGISVAKVAQLEVDAVGFAVPAEDALAFLEREAPGVNVLRDTATDSATGDDGQPVREPGGAGEEASSVRPAMRVLAVAVLALLLSVMVVRAALRAKGQRAVATEEETGPARRTVPRAVFRVSSGAGESELDLRLPSVAGSAPNADIPLPGGGVAAYHVRFSPAGDGVIATDLSDGEGMYCADACVATAALGPGESIRAAASTITLIRTYEAVMPHNNWYSSG